MNKQTIIKSKHTTSDGKSFENFDEAVAHQASLDLVQEFAGISGAYVSGLAFPKAESPKGLAAARTVKRREVTLVLSWLKSHGVDLTPVQGPASQFLAAEAEKAAQAAQAAEAEKAAQAAAEKAAEAEKDAGAEGTAG